MFDLLATPRRRRLLFALLYLSEGAPIGFIWWAMPTRLRAAGVDVGDITWLTATLVLPWTFKFLWAPLVDALQTRWWTLKQWIIGAQTLMGLALLPLLWLDLHENYTLVVSCLLCHAVAAATQDVAIDALCIQTTHLHERGRLNGWMQAGMLLGRAGLGGGALALASLIGDTGVVVLLIGVIWCSLTVLLLTRMPAKFGKDEPTSLAFKLHELRNSAAIALANRNTWIGLAFALTGGAAYEGLGAIAGPLLVDSGFSSTNIGYFFGIPVVAAMICGSLIGGRMADRISRRRSVAVSLLMVVMFAAIVGLTVLPSETSSEANEIRMILLIYALTGVYFGIGLFTACSYALFMDMTTPQVAGTQFSTFMGATNGCEAASGFAIGAIIAASSYSAGIWLLCVPSLLALVFLRWINIGSGKDAN